MPSFDRRILLAGAGAMLMCRIGPLAAAQTATPADAGFTPDLDERLDKLIADKRASGLHGVVVVRSRRIVLERYFEGEDNNWGVPLGSVRFGPDTLHNMYSVTKSIVALIYGVALAEGKVPPPSAPLYEQFPEYADLVAADERRKRQTIAHALSMSLGAQWNEIGLLYDSPANDEIGMDRWRRIATASCLTGRWSARRASVGTTAAVQPRCSGALSPGERAARCRTMRALSCSTPWGSAGPNGSPARKPGSANNPAVTVNRSPPPGCA